MDGKQGKINMAFASIKSRLNALFVVIVSLLLVAFAAINYVKTKAALERSVDMQVKSALARLSLALPNVLWNFENSQVEQIVISELSAPFIVGIAITNGEKVLGGSMRGKDGQAEALKGVPEADTSQSADLVYVDAGKSNPVGRATVYITYNGIKQALKAELIWTGLQILVFDIIIVLVLSLVLNSIVLRPLQEIGTALNAIAQGEADLTQRLNRGSSVEFNAVTDGFNTFIERLQGVIQRFSGGIVTVSQVSCEIANGNRDLSSRTESQASSLEETSASMEEMIATVAQNAHHAEMANNMVKTTGAVASKGGSVVANVIATMGSINSSSRKIIDIISVIDGIAFQTNILALNAAVEAARAGDQGRGFAVVAAEVRSLAGRSAAAAKEVKRLIDESVSNVSIGSQLVDEAGATMTEILASVGQVTQVVAQIQSASSEQMLGIKQINDALRQIDTTTQQNAALVQQATAAVDALQAQASDLANVASAFKFEPEPTTHLSTRRIPCEA